MREMLPSALAVMSVWVQEALIELAAWLETHPKEIIIIYCSHFESLTEEDHNHLVEVIISLFRGKLVSSQVQTYFLMSNQRRLCMCKLA